MPVTPGKTPISAVTTSDQRVGVQKKRDTDLLTTQLKYAMTMLDAKDISDKLLPCVAMVFLNSAHRKTPKNVYTKTRKIGFGFLSIFCKSFSTRFFGKTFL
jgi:hypothetical protein